MQVQLAAANYSTADDLAMALHLALILGRPLLLEGAAGVGKTQVAQTLATQKATRLIRLQCYEGPDASHAIYEWNYQRQLLAIRAGSGESAEATEARIFPDRYLLERPLLAAIRQPVSPVLLIDEIDRADAKVKVSVLVKAFLGSRVGRL